jgi:hypothetical protein
MAQTTHDNRRLTAAAERLAASLDAVESLAALR